MTLTSGTRVGQYEVLASLGAGGMGEVYRARDTKLGREVALKVLPEAFAFDGDRTARFKREAHLLASLNHPNIAAIYGFEDSSHVHALVLELVEGPTLADRIALGPVPVAEALAIARQIAEALEAAHEQGVIHRDLKPANISVRPDGTVKVLDFGLAKAMDAGGTSAPGGDGALSPTVTSPAMVTGVGMIVGTAAYMSPEQARGKPADRRADIWAFGVVVYEMLTGQRLFPGETVSDTLAAVLKTEPSWDALPRATPPALRRVIRSCLEKDSRRRLQAIGDRRLLLDEAPVPESRSGVTMMALAAAVVLAVALGALAFVHLNEVPPRSGAVRFQVPLPEGSLGPIVRLSPDGRTLAMTASEGGRRQMWLRALDSLEARALPGTEGAAYPFWSPDGAFIGFFADGQLKKIAVAGGAPQILCEAPSSRGGTWSADDVIVFAPGPGSGIARVPAAGGVPTQVTTPADAQELHRFPEFLPGGRRFLYLVTEGKPETTGVYAGSLDGDSPVRVLPDSSSAMYVPPSASGGRGHLLFRREGRLMAQPFDPDALSTIGEMVPLAEQVAIAGHSEHGAFSASENGVLAFELTGSGALELDWMDRTGTRVGTAAQTGLDRPGAALSPDDKTIAYAVSKGGDAADIWLYDVARGVPSRFTFLPGVSGYAAWSRDGSRLTFETGDVSLYQKRVDSAGKEDLLLRAGINIAPLDWSPDGKFILYKVQSPSQEAHDLWLLPLEGDRTPVAYLQTAFSETAGQFSPDGRWIAYASNESGQAQVYVQGFPTGAKRQISTAGGDQPRWRRDGTELFYLAADGRLMAVPVKPGQAFETGSPRPLFEMQPVYTSLSGLFAYQPTADGQRFLVTVPVSGAAIPPVTIVLNWQTGLP